MTPHLNHIIKGVQMTGNKFLIYFVYSISNLTEIILDYQLIIKIICYPLLSGNLSKQEMIYSSFA